MRRLAILGVTVVLVAAACGGDEGGNAGAKLAVPRAPSGLEVQVDGVGVRLSWDDLSSDEDAFVIGRVELGAAGAPFTAESLAALVEVIAGQDGYLDLAVEKGKFYAYGVAAKNRAGTTAFVVQAGPPVTPRGSIGVEPCTVATRGDLDRDGDGVLDALEIEGWTVRVNEDGRGSIQERQVQSKADSPDGDGDGVCDARERLLRTDPTRADTDGDGLSDLEELARWGSSPLNVDSDGDAGSESGSVNPAFFDGEELSRHGTSPTLADTDGDGQSDFEEKNQNATNPLLANLPSPRIEVVPGAVMGVFLNVTTSTGSSVSDAYSSGLTKGMETSTSRTSSTATTVTSELSAEVSGSASVGYPASAGVSVSASVTSTEGQVAESSASFEASSSSSSRSTYESTLTRTSEQNETIESGRITVPIRIVNDGERTFALSDLVISAVRRDLANPGTFTTIASLPLTAAGTIVLAPGGRTDAISVEATVPAGVAMDLLANPGTVFFRPATFRLTDRTSEDFEFTIGETTNNRTAVIVIDSGGENGQPLQTLRVATNVVRREGGKLEGLRMAEALRAGGLDGGWVTATGPSGRKILTGIRGVETAPGKVGSSRFWVVIAAENNTHPDSVASRLLNPNLDFDDLRLLSRDRVYLAYVSDQDADGLFDREERLYGTSDGEIDTDQDGRSDRDEIREGWRVLADLPYYDRNPVVYSSPVLADADLDGLTDAEEEAQATDPNRADTDADGLVDGEDPEPLQGLLRPAVFPFGTLAYTFPTGLVVDGDGLMYVNGWGGGDRDRDAVIGNTSSSFATALNPDGSTRWTHEIENDEALAPRLVLTSSGPATVARLPAGAFPGASNGAGWHVVQFGADPTPVLAPLRWKDQAKIDGMRLDYFGVRPDGEFVATGLSPSDQYKEQAVFFDAAGTVRLVNLNQFPFRGQGMGVDPVSGELWMFWTTPASRCFAEILAPDGSSRFADLCSVYSSIGLALPVGGGSHVVYGLDAAAGSGAPAPGLVWRDGQGANVFPAEAGYISNLAADGRRVIYVKKACDPGCDSEVIARLPGGGLAFSFTVPEEDGVVQALSFDPRGNLYMLLRTENGFGGRTSRAGGYAIVRNPHLLLEP